MAASDNLHDKQFVPSLSEKGENAIANMVAGGPQYARLKTYGGAVEPAFTVAIPNSPADNDRVAKHHKRFG